MTVDEAKMLTMQAVILIYPTLVGGLLVYVGPDIASIFLVRP